MVIYNAATRELTAKIVYYGPGLGGKTTNLHLLHERLEPGTVGKLLNLATQTDRTIYFDLLPVELGDIKGYKIRFQLATVPGQTAFNETRRVVLKGTDGIVFVADSQWTMLPKNLESWQNLKDNLKANGVSFEGIPIVVQYNKRDLSDILSVDALQEALGLSSYPFVEAVASAGRGVTETFKLISKLTFVDLLRRLQGRRPEEPGAPPVKRENDDLLSWKDSLLHRAAAGTAAAKRPLSLVPSPPAEEAPFSADEEVPAAAESEGPFVDTPVAAAESALPEPAEMAAPVDPAERATEKIDFLTPSIAPIEIELPSDVPSLSADPLGDPTPPPGWPVSPAFSDTGEPGSAALESRLEEAVARGEETRKEIDRIAETLTALTARLDTLDARSRSLEATLGEARHSLAARLETLENRSGETNGEELEGRIRAVEERVSAAEKRQRIGEDDVSMALRAFGERGEKLHAQLAALSDELARVETALQEKTGQSRREADDIRAQMSGFQVEIEEKLAQGRREAEDIRSQIAPLLDAHGHRGESDERLLQEFDRLRESLAESLGDLSERLRRAVKGV